LHISPPASDATGNTFIAARVSLLSENSLLLMTATTRTPHLIWHDRFHTPTVEALLTDLNRDVQAAARHARTLLFARPDIDELVSWQGVWKWAIVYQRAATPDRASAFLIPTPQRPRLCIPVSAGVYAALHHGNTEKFIRDALAHCALVDGTRWPEWELTGKMQVEELVKLAPG